VIPSALLKLTVSIACRLAYFIGGVHQFWFLLLIEVVRKKNHWRESVTHSSSCSSAINCFVGILQDRCTLWHFSHYLVAAYLEWGKCWRRPCLPLASTCLGFHPEVVEGWCTPPPIHSMESWHALLETGTVAPIVEGTCPEEYTATPAEFSLEMSSVKSVWIVILLHVCHLKPPSKSMN